MTKAVTFYQRKRDFLKQATAAGQEVILKGLPHAITIPRAGKPSVDNMKFVWVRRNVGGPNTQNKGLTKNQVRVIRLLEEAGLGKMLVRL